MTRPCLIWLLLILSAGCAQDPITPSEQLPEAFLIANFSEHSLELIVASVDNDSAVVITASAAKWIYSRWRVDRVVLEPSKDTLFEGEESIKIVSTDDTVRLKWVGIAGTTREGVLIETLRR